MGFANYNPEWSAQIESMLDDLCLLLSDCMYEDEQTEIIIQETKIFEFAQEFLPQLDSDLNEFFDYIHETLRSDGYFDESDVEEYMMRIHNHLHRLDDYAKIYINYSDELSKHNQAVYSSADISFNRMLSYYDQINNLSDQSETASYDEYDEYIRLTPEEKREIAAAKKAQKTQALISYLRTCMKPVSYYKIRQTLPKTTTQIIELAKEDLNVVCYENALWEISQLSSKMTADQVNDLLSDVHNTFFIDKRHTVHEIYRQLYERNHALFRKLYVDSPYDLFGVLKALYPKDFVYSRPNIGLPGEVFTKPVSTIQKYLVGRYKTAIPDLEEYIDSLGYDLHCNLKLINALKEIYLLDQKTVIPAYRIELSEENKINLIQMILDELQENQEVQEAVAIRDLNCVARLPSGGIPWTEWLLYSFLDKASWPGKDSDTMIYTHTTSPTLARAIPLVSLYPSISKETRLIIANEHRGNEAASVTLSADDLSHLDELIEDEIEYDWDLDKYDFDE